MTDRRRKLVPDGDPCVQCGKKLYSSDDFEYSRTRRGRLLFIHRDCWKALLKAGVQ